MRTLTWFEEQSAFFNNEEANTSSIRYEFEYVRPLLKSGKQSNKRWKTIVSRVWSEVYACSLCGVIGGLRRITDRVYVYWPDCDALNGPHCVACWNKIKPLNRRKEYCDSVQHLVSVLSRKRKTMPELPHIKDLDSFRKYLCRCIEDVRNGDLDTVRALRIAKIAAQVNESLRVELSATRLQLEREHKAPKLGRLPIGLEQCNLD